MRLEGSLPVENRVSVITLGVSDLETSIRFYESGLKFPRQPFDSEKIAFFKLYSGQILALFPIGELAEDACLPNTPSNGGFRGMTLAHNVEAEEDVEKLLEEAKAAGGTILKEAQEPEWGGLSGYFADPDGHAWEVAYPPLVF